MPQHDNDIPEFVRAAMHKAIMSQMPTMDELKQMAHPEQKANLMEPKKQAPSVGRVVHFVFGDEHVPALIIDPAFVQDEEEVQALQVFTMTDGAFTTAARYDAACAGGTWHWPEYVA